MATDASATEFDRSAECAERTSAQIDTAIRSQSQIIRTHIDTCPKSSGTIGGSTHTSLHLKVFDGRGEVGHIHPKDGLRFGVVEGYSIGSYVDAIGIGATHAKAGISDTRTGIAGGYHGGSQHQQIGDVTTIIGLGKFGLANVGVSDRGFRRGASSYDLYGLELHIAKTIYLAVGDECLCRQAERQDG